MSQFCDPSEDCATVPSGKKAEHRITNKPSNSNREEEFFQRILRRARRHDKWNHWHWRGQQGLNQEGAEARPSEKALHPFDDSWRRLFLECFLSSFARYAIHEIGAKDGADCGHCGVERPQRFLTRGEDD